MALKAIVRVGLVWYKSTDLRLHDHGPLLKAHQECTYVEHVFCIDSRWLGDTKRGFKKVGNHRWRFLLESLTDLNASLSSKESRLVIRTGLPEDIIPEIAREIGATHIYSHSEVCEEERNVERDVFNKIEPSTQMKIFHGNYLFNPDNLPFSYPGGIPEIFTQFRKGVESKGIIQPALCAPTEFRPSVEGLINPGCIPTWDDLCVQKPSIIPHAVLPFEGGETAAIYRVQSWIWDADCLKSYKETRNGMFGSEYSSKLSPWLAFGCISPRLIYQEIKRYEKERVSNESTYWLVFELLWRDFFRFAAAKHGNRIFFQGGPQGKKQKWHKDLELINAWKEGSTGYPFIDANMRELKKTGFMSNRGRQIVASFFVRDLGQDWRYGAEWFEEQLIDYDPCSNWGNWNYSAGVGADPREDRYFNIVKQAKTYDPDGQFIRLWCPEIAHLSTDILQNPPLSGVSARNGEEKIYCSPICPLKFSSFKGIPSTKVVGKSSGFESKRDAPEKPKNIMNKAKRENRRVKKNRVQNDYMGEN